MVPRPRPGLKEEQHAHFQPPLGEDQDLQVLA